MYNDMNTSVATAMAVEPASELLERAVHELPSVDGAFLFDPEGSILTCAGPEAANDAAVQALVGGLVSLADRTSTELGRGALRHIVAQGQMGHLVASVLDSGHTLAILGAQDARLGLLLHDMEWISMRLSPSLA